MIKVLDVLLAGLRFVFVALIYLFLWHILRLMYREMWSGNTTSALKARGRPVLVVWEAKNASLKKGERYLLGENITIGRDSHNDIVIDDSHVSAHHALITRSGEEWRLRDLASTNGTYLNDRLITSPQGIRPGDRIRIGGVTFNVGWEDASPGHFPYRTGAAR